ncbi:polysaccharide deacetylase family protein [Flavobacterium sp.]|uniref:polysaccharide deacetylase family protein n=1 Tax=Flavobacterium sp. TaxID=239 RepID=UPI00375020C8
MARLPILMYHNVVTNSSLSFGLSICTEKFEEQLKYLQSKKYTSFFVSELENRTEIPQKSIVLTFDDVTENQLSNAVLLLEKYNFKATFFIPFSYIGKTDLWNKDVNYSPEKIMTIEQLKSLDSNFIELAHHSFEHKKYSELSVEEIQTDFDNSFKTISDNNLKVYAALAYPYGNYPKKGVEKANFFQILEQNNIKFAFRIGNRVNKFPFKDKFEIMRIDVKGEESLTKFKLKLKFGKLKLF